MLILYSTLGCHLCEQALGLLQQQGVQVEERDIVDAESWLQAYATRIPVVSDGVRELDWPFDAQRLARWLEADPLS